MILSCPACGTRYLVPDDAIGPEGRQVRCASCRHSWFQDGPDLSAAPAVATSPTISPPMDDPRGEDAPSAPPAFVAPPGYAPVHADKSPHATGAGEQRRHVYGEDEVEHIRYPDVAAPVPAPTYRPRRNPARMWTLVAIAAALLMLALTAAVVAFGPPDLGRRFGLADAGTPALLIQAVGTERRRMASGNELFSASGRIMNPTDRVQPVPDIRANLLDGQDRIVYGWTIARPVAKLAPGASVEFNGAVLDVPRNARNLDLSLATTGG